MDEFKVKLDQMKGSVEESKQIAKELERAHSDLLSVKRRINFKISHRERIDRRLTMQGQALETEKSKMDKVTSALSDIIGLYEKTEMELCGQKAPTAEKDTPWDKLIDMIWPSPGPGITPIPISPIIPPINPADIFKFLPFVLKPWAPIFINVGYPPLVPMILINTLIPDGGSNTLPHVLDILKGTEGVKTGGGEKVLSWKEEWKINGINDWDTEAKAGVAESIISKAFEDAAERGKKEGANKTDKIANSLSGIKDKVDDFADNHSKTKESKRVYDTETKQWTDVDTKDKEASKAFDDELERNKMGTDVKATLFSASAAGAIWSDEISTQGKIGGKVPGSASAKASFGQGEVHAEGYMGLFQSDPTTGELKFKPGIGVDVGASVTAFTAEEQAMLGGDMLGAYVKSTQTIGKVGAEAEANVGLYDKNGKFNPTAYAGFSAQAIAGEITGAVGAKVLGADVSASGSLNYGVGAHANFGYKDGKLSMDIGATLGVGASVKLEVDVSGTIDAAKGVAEAAWNKAGEALDKAGDTINSLKDGAKKLFGWGK